MYKIRELFKAKKTIVIALLLLLPNLYLFSQTWEYKISKDYEFSIQDVWGESGLYTAKFVLYNQKTAFVKQIKVNDDDFGKVIFPDGFIQTRGKFNKDTITEFNWYIEVKRRRVAAGKILYNPSPNTLLQMSKHDYLSFEKKDKIWGEVVDAFNWDDKQGENIFIRSKAVDKKTNDVHLYLYHFLKQEEEYLLLRKFTDYVKGCNLDVNANHIIESIELTDIDKDTIAEISFIYTVDCSSIEDSLPTLTKLMLTTKGEKYSIRGTISPKKNEIKHEYELGGKLEKESLYKRFLIKKWKKQAGEQETIYN